jgi:hypothetical protein
MKYMYRIMQRYLKPQDRAGITHLDIPEWDKFEFMLVMIIGSCFTNVPTIQWWLTVTCLTFFLHMVDWRFHFVEWVSYRRIVIKEDLDAALLKQHMRHFSQAMGTPFTVNPLLNTFGEYAEKPTGVAFREGTANIDDIEVNDITKEFLKELQRQPEDPPEIDTTITYKDIRRNYKIWDESTSTSPSGRYLSLYKTWIKIPEEKEDDYKGITSEEFFTMIQNIIDAAVEMNHTLSRWGAIHNLYILKNEAYIEFIK